MSGTFEDIHVPPTLVSFAICTEDAGRIISPEFKQAGSNVYRVRTVRNPDGMPDFDNIKNTYASVCQAIRSGRVLSAYAVERGGVLAAVTKMALGNGIGAVLDAGDLDDLSNKAYGDLVLEGNDLEFEKIGITGGDAVAFKKESVPLCDLRGAFEGTLARVYPISAPDTGDIPDTLFTCKSIHVYSGKKARPRITIPAFPGTNCEYDSAAAFNRAGGIAETFVLRNRSASDIEYSITALAERIGRSQILMIPGGFSGGDEPDGSGKFIATVLRAPQIRDAVHALLNRDGLILGICNGFQALIKVGLVPYGEIRDMREDSPTLTFNRIGRHVSRAVRTRVTSSASPWLAHCRPGEMHTVVISHGEGRFVADAVEALMLLESGQVATQYVDEAGKPTMGEGNPNGSLLAVEGLLSPDGRVFGKMAHAERFTAHTLKNIPGENGPEDICGGRRIFPVDFQYAKRQAGSYLCLSFNNRFIPSSNALFRVSRWPAYYGTVMCITTFALAFKPSVISYHTTSLPVALESSALVLSEESRPTEPSSK